MALEELNDQPRKHIPATEAQRIYARDLGIDFRDDIDRFVLSRMIEEVTSRMPATENQKNLLHSLNIHFPEDINRRDSSTLIEQVLEFKDRIKDAVRSEYDQEQRRLGMLVEHADVDQLLWQLEYRGKLFVALILDDDEFRYSEDAPIKGQLVFNRGLDVEDVKYLLGVLNREWVKGFDRRQYLRDCFDSRAPAVDIAIRVLE
jgi:hypothetical protein